MSTRNHSRLLLDEEPLQVLPSLAKAIGINDAILLQQINYWLKIASKAGDKRKFIDGRWWTYGAYREWQTQLSWLTLEGLRRIIYRLEKLKLLESKQHNLATGDARKWYTIDYEKVDALFPEEEAQAEPEPEAEVDEGASGIQYQMGCHSVPDGVVTNTTSYIDTETTTETSSDITPPTPPEPDGSRRGERRGKAQGKVDQQEYRRMFDEVCDSTALGDLLIEFADVLAARNASGKMRDSRRYNDVAKPYLKLAEECNESQIEYGLNAAIRKPAHSFGYVVTVARSYYDDLRSLGKPHLKPIQGGKGAPHSVDPSVAENAKRWAW